MQLSAGSIIKATGLLKDSNFEDAVILLTEYNERGAVGFVLNQPHARYLNELEEFKSSIAFPLFAGGPVDTEHLFFIHRRPELIPGGSLISGRTIPLEENTFPLSPAAHVQIDQLYLGGDFTAAVAAINNGQISTNNLKIFIGYCGWDHGDLETEIQEGSWEVIAEYHHIFAVLQTETL